MGLLKFENLPVNTLVGADRATFDAVVAGAEIDPEYRKKYRLTKSIGAIMQPFYRINERRYAKLPPEAGLGEEAPIFILGHWRSGTTYLHNLLSCDRQFGYCTTFQTVFPHLMLWGQPFFKLCMKWFMPSKRPTDSMTLAPDLPQEEEFALVNMMPYSHYNFWTFPRRMDEYRERYLLFNTITEEERAVFKEALRKMIRLGLINTGGRRFLSKNPPHTGRIRTLLEVYPDAKFIYLVRNPYTVFESTRSFFGNMLASTQLQHITEEQLQEEILAGYVGLHEKYEAEKGLIPAGNLVELRFEDLEADPLARVADIYAQLGIVETPEAAAAIKAHVEGQKGFRKNRYDYAPETIRLVEQHWGEMLEQWNYRL